MNLFHISNFFSVLMAESIIQKFNLKDNIALVINNKTDDYFDKIKYNINKEYWNKVINSRFNYSFNKLKLKNDLSRNAKHISNFLIEEKIYKIFLSNIQNSFEDRFLYNVSKKNKLEINFYEEGLNFYLPPLNISNNLNYIKILIKKILYKNKIYDFSKEYNEYVPDNIYCVFPKKNILQFKNHIYQIKPNFDDAKIKKEIYKFKLDTIFLSRPLSEDKIVTRDEEIEILKNFFKEFSNEKIYFKFHPRETKEKRDYLKNTFKIKELPDEIKNFSAEKIVFNSSIKTLIGYETGTLAYASELKNIKVYSLLKRIKKNSKYLDSFYELYSKEFKKIKYI